MSADREFLDEVVLEGYVGFGLNLVLLPGLNSFVATLLEVGRVEEPCHYAVKGLDYSLDESVHIEEGARQQTANDISYHGHQVIKWREIDDACDSFSLVNAVNDIESGEENLHRCRGKHSSHDLFNIELLLHKAHNGWDEFGLYACLERVEESG